MGEEDEVEEVEEFLYLDLDDALEIYAAIIGGSPAQAADHLRNRDVLAGALARPINYASYEDADLGVEPASVGDILRERLRPLSRAG